jgi:hypothetical protein
MDANAKFHVVNRSLPGHIYLVNAVGTNKFKIGKTAGSVAHRIKELQIGSPIRLRYVYHAYVDRMNRTERELHYQFVCFRSIGEWFSLSDTNVKECITLMRLAQIHESSPVFLQEEEENVDEQELENLSLTSLPVRTSQPLGLGHRFHQVHRALFMQGTESECAERALQLKGKGWGKAKIILEVWGVSKGGSQKYKDAEILYERLIRGET